jgi:hypothetical protein
MKSLLIACTVCVVAACELASRAVLSRKPDWGARQELGRVVPGEFLPAGNLAWLPATLDPGDGSTRDAWLILNVEQPTRDKANSYAARLSANCRSGLVTIGHLVSFEGPNADGRELSRKEMKPPQFLATTDSAGELARSALCRTRSENRGNGIDRPG